MQTTFQYKFLKLHYYVSIKKSQIGVTTSMHFLRRFILITKDLSLFLRHNRQLWLCLCNSKWSAQTKNKLDVNFVHLFFISFLSKIKLKKICFLLINYHPFIITNDKSCFKGKSLCLFAIVFLIKFILPLIQQTNLFMLTRRKKTPLILTLTRRCVRIR